MLWIFNSLGGCTYNIYHMTVSDLPLTWQGLSTTHSVSIFLNQHINDQYVN